MQNTIIKFSILITMIVSSTMTMAGVLYNYERGAGVFGGNSQLSYDSIQASFNQDTNAFSFVVDYNGNSAEGGWLVISPGDNPKNSSSELGIAYFDSVSGDAWVYSYNGLNNDESYLTNDFLGYFSGAYSTVGDVATLAFDASSINGTLDSGFEFGARIGIWFHPSANLNAIGTNMGLSLFDAQSTGWLDTNNDGDCTNQNNGCITAVPEPTTIALIVFGLVLLMRTHHKQNTKVAAAYAKLSARIDRKLYSPNS